MNNVQLLAIILVLLRNTWVYLGVISDGLCSLIEGFRYRIPDAKKTGFLSVVCGICALWGTCYLGIQLLVYWLFV